MYNRVIMIGRMVVDPELRTTQSGKSVLSCRIAVDRPYSKDKEKKSDFFSIVAWQHNAEFISRYFSKGRLIGVEGSLQTREYTDKQGDKRMVFEIVVDRAFFTESKASAGGAASTGASAAASTEGYTSGSFDDFQTIGDDDDLPF